MISNVIDFKTAIEGRKREIDHCPSRLDMLAEERRRRPLLSLQDKEYLRCRGIYNEKNGIKPVCKVVDILEPVIDRWING